MGIQEEKPVSLTEAIARMTQEISQLQRAILELAESNAQVRRDVESIRDQKSEQPESS